MNLDNPVFAAICREGDVFELGYIFTHHLFVIGMALTFLGKRHELV